MTRRGLVTAAAVALVGTVLVPALVSLVYVKVTGLSARATPGPVETGVARRLRALAIPGEYANRRNPAAPTTESVRSGMAHFADHCASCHANDGSGDTAIGKGFYPPAPDMRQSATQALSDGELFYVIEHGIRFTGMPAWGVEGEEQTSWDLVNFIRRLPAITPAELEEMAALNPRPPAEIRLEIEEERFLRGEDPVTERTP